MPPDHLLTLKQIAARLGVSPGTVRLWAKSGRVPVYQAAPMGRLLFSWPEVEAALAGWKAPERQYQTTA
jgi:excisionase family DNA binding protein